MKTSTSYTLLRDHRWMGEALKEAEKAARIREVPVGAVWVLENKIIARGHNKREQRGDPTSHAEMEVIRQASKVLGDWRLGGSLYVTLEPCPMCLGAMIQSRIHEVIFGCRDPKAGAAGSIVHLTRDYSWNHRLNIRCGIRQKECKEILQSFFKALRLQKEKKMWRGGRVVEGG